MMVDEDHDARAGAREGAVPSAASFEFPPGYTGLSLFGSYVVDRFV